MPITILIATRNKHKIEEIRSILGAEYQFVSLERFPNAPVPDETGSTFAQNATIKAVELANWLASLSPRPEIAYTLADDSGLEVDALHGAPGVHSARFAAIDTGAKGNSPDAENNAKLLRLLNGVSPEKRTGRFRCAIAWTPVPAHSSLASSPACNADEAELATSVFEGACEGRILLEPQGAHGFGYDPLFVPNGYSASFAELGEEVKNKLSHRADALRKLSHFLRGQGSR